MRAPVIRALAVLEPGGEDLRQAAAGDLPAIRSLGARRRPGDRYRRAQREGLLAIEAIEAALAEAGAGPQALGGDRTGLVYVTGGAYGASNRTFIEGQAGSIHFPYTAPAAVPVEAAIEFGLTGPYGILIGGPPAALSAIWQAASWLEDGAADRVLVLAVETFEECAGLHRRARRLAGRALVETAACLWLEPGEGELTLEWDAARARRPGGPPAHWAAEPLVALAAWRAGAGGPDVALDGEWRGRRARLHWTGARVRAPAEPSAR